MRSLAGDSSVGLGNGGMDVMMLGHMVICRRNGLTMDQNVYDAAAWSSVVALNESSIGDRGDAQDFPNFTQESLENCAAAGTNGARR